MIATGWKEDAAKLIWWADPTRDEPTYLVDAAECRHLFTLGEGVAGFTSGRLSQELREILGRKWDGPGFAAVLDSSQFPNANDLIGACLHEFAHHVLFSAGVDLPERPTRQSLTVPRLVSLWPTDAPRWQYHGSRFLRVVCHVAHRVRFHSPIDTWDLVHEIYTLANVLAYRSALGDEPQRRAWEPLAAIAASDPPAEFREFAECDLQRAHRQLATIPPQPPGTPAGPTPGGHGAGALAGCVGKVGFQILTPPTTTPERMPERL